MSLSYFYGLVLAVTILCAWQVFFFVFVVAALHYTALYYPHNFSNITPNLLDKSDYIPRVFLLRYISPWAYFAKSH